MCGTSIRWTGDDKEKFSRLVFEQKVVQISHLKSRNQPWYCNIKDLEAESVRRYVSLYLDLANDSAVQLLYARFYLFTCIVRCKTSLFAATWSSTWDKTSISIRKVAQMSSVLRSVFTHPGGFFWPRRPDRQQTASVASAQGQIKKPKHLITRSVCCGLSGYPNGLHLWHITTEVRRS